MQSQFLGQRNQSSAIECEHPRLLGPGQVGGTGIGYKQSHLGHRPEDDKDGVSCTETERRAATGELRDQRELECNAT